MSQEHKDALVLGRQQARVIKAYLNAIADRKPGRPVTKESLERKLALVDEKIEAADNPLEKVDLIQSRLDTEKVLAQVGDAENLEELEAGFAAYAKGYSERKGISYTAWRQIGVPASVLKSAGIRETRRR